MKLPEGDVIPEFKLIRISAEGLSDRNLFICHHLTPELIRKPEWEVHQNGAQYIKSVVILVEKPSDLKDYYIRLFGTLNVTLTDSTMTVQVGRLNMIFVSDRDLDLLLPGIVSGAEEPELPHLFAMTIAVKDVEDTGDYLTQAGLKTQKISGGVVRVQPNDACGVLMEFVQD